MLCVVQTITLLNEKITSKYSNLVSPFHEALPHFYFCAAIKPHVHITMVVEEGLKHVKHLGHLGEDQHPVPTGLQGAQQICQNLQLAAVVLDQPGVRSLHCKPVGKKFENPVTSC